MSSQRETDALVNSGYGSSDETETLLDAQVSSNLPKIVKAGSHTSSNGPTASAKPILIRQDRTQTYLTGQPLSVTAGSEESGGDDTQNVKIDPETLVKPETPKISISSSRQSDDNVKSYQLTPTSRCRVVSPIIRRSSVTPQSGGIFRTGSKESIQSAKLGRLSPNLKFQSTVVPPVLISSPTNNGRVIRQSSQPESTHSCTSTCAHGSNSNTPQAQSSSLRQLKEPKESSDGISGIAAETLRINGAMRPFKQVR
jgi:hypothetical protein